jgi:hypothetical protein
VGRVGGDIFVVIVAGATVSDMRSLLWGLVERVSALVFVIGSTALLRIVDGSVRAVDEIRSRRSSGRTDSPARARSTRRRRAGIQAAFENRILGRCGAPGAVR